MWNAMQCNINVRTKIFMVMVTVTPGWVPSASEVYIFEAPIWVTTDSSLFMWPLILSGVWHSDCRMSWIRGHFKLHFVLRWDNNGRFVTMWCLLEIGLFQIGQFQFFMLSYCSTSHMWWPSYLVHYKGELKHSKVLSKVLSKDLDKW